MTDRPGITIDLTNPTLQAEMDAMRHAFRQLSVDSNNLLIQAASLKATLEGLNRVEGCLDADR